MGFTKPPSPPPPPPPPEPEPEMTEEEIAALDREEEVEAARERISDAGRRTNRGRLRIPLSGSSGRSGLSLS